jgi:DNA-binding response OmpR family regulator
MSEASEQRRVVLVEDDRESREILASMLRDEDFEVLEAANGLKLISILHADHPDAIILDVNLSWIDGFELCRSVKQNEEFQSIPVVFVSGRTSPEDIRRGFEAGAQAYFRKPLDFEALVSKLREIVGQPRPEA